MWDTENWVNMKIWKSTTYIGKCLIDQNVCVQCSKWNSKTCKRLQEDTGCLPTPVLFSSWLYTSPGWASEDRFPSRNKKLVFLHFWVTPFSLEVSELYIVIWQLMETERKNRKQRSTTLVCLFVCFLRTTSFPSIMDGMWLWWLIYWPWSLSHCLAVYPTNLLIRAWQWLTSVPV